MPNYIQIKDGRHQRACRHQTSLHCILSHFGSLSNSLSHSFLHLLLTLSPLSLILLISSFPFICFMLPCPSFICHTSLIPLLHPSLSSHLYFFSFSHGSRMCVGSPYSLAHIPPNGFKYYHTSQSLGTQVILYFIHSKKLRSQNTHSSPLKTLIHRFAFHLLLYFSLTRIFLHCSLFQPNFPFCFLYVFFFFGAVDQ